MTTASQALTQLPEHEQGQHSVLHQPLLENSMQPVVSLRQRVPLSQLQHASGQELLAQQQSFNTLPLEHNPGYDALSPNCATTLPGSEPHRTSVHTDTRLAPLAARDPRAAVAATHLLSVPLAQLGRACERDTQPASSVFADPAPGV